MAAQRDAGAEIQFEVNKNLRSMTEISVKGQHVSIEGLREHIREDPTLWGKIQQLNLGNIAAVKSTNFPNKPKILDYLYGNIPKYPSPVEFHVSRVAHVTEEESFESILRTGEINSEYSWWSLYIDKTNINYAGNRYLRKNFPHQTEQRPFLHHFTNSPAFKKESRYGSYRFKFHLVDLMELYQEQLCRGEEPVLRVMKTMFYKQEILYAVLIHSPLYNEKFTELPLLENSEFVRYQDGKMVWRAQAISNSLEYELLVTAEGNVNVQRLANPKYYVWDHVALAFHMPKDGEGLKVPRDRLIEALDVCEISEMNLLRKRCRNDDERTARFEAAKQRVTVLKNEPEEED